MLVLFILLSVGVSFLCSIAEAVLLSINPAYIENHKIDNPKQAKLLASIRIDKIDQSLAAILTLNTIAHTVGAIVAGAKAAQVFGSAWIGVFSALMTLAILLLSEIVPKTIGAIYWKPLAPAVARFINWLIIVLYPLIWLSEKVTKLIAKDKGGDIFSRDEFVAMARVGEKAGDIEDYESRIFKQLFEFGTFTAKDIMTPRTVISGLNQELTINQAYDIAIKEPFSRFPLFEESIDSVSGLVLKDDIFSHASTDKGEQPLSDLRREITCVFASKKLYELLELLAERKQHLALIVDEYGATEGLVTMEDLLETLLGIEIMDEVDRVDDMQQLARRKWLSRAKAKGIDLEQQDSSESER
ncbi:CNNM domain-containing protein [Kangiella sp. TOML190]|uniref:CNNM domain-containing protein n=1 Tax=Kangiella sp. TOML190 TaxID=2931351 RepID=UPI00203D6C72|nr:hemolysin family protein [Kangiella sp. TOML190]